VLLSDIVATLSAQRQDIKLASTTQTTRIRNQSMPLTKFAPTRTEPSTLFVGSVEKGFDVLKAFRRGQAELGLRDLSLSEIARLADLDKSATQRFTNTLVKLGYLAKDPVTKRYRPDVNLTDFYYTYMMSNRLAEIAMPRLIEAGKVHDTTVNLCELSGTDVIYTIRIPHEKSRFEATVSGRRVPAFCTAGGCVILANMSEREREFVLAASDRKPITRSTITEMDHIHERIENAGRNMYDLGVSQAIVNEISTASPVFNSEGRVVAAVQIPVYQPQWTPEEAHRKIVPLAIETARAISGSM